MSELTADEIGRLALDFQILAPGQLQSILSELGGRDASPQAFAQVAQRRELLTNFQMDRLLEGKRSGYYYGDYKVLYLVGMGTFARVYRAVHRESGKVVAVKVLRQRQQAKRDDFVREGEMGLALRHPNIVPIYEVHAERTNPFFVMEFVEGSNLREFVKARKKLTVEESVRLVSDIVTGLNYALEKGVSHRDLKMSNVLVTSVARAKLVDFGLAAIDGGDLGDSETHRTIDYAGLERASGVRKDDKRSDIFFAGCIFYHMLCGRPPLLETKSRNQRLNLDRYKSIRSITEFESGLPPIVLTVLNKAMAFQPEKRYATPMEMLLDLRQVKKRLESGDAAAPEVLVSEQEAVPQDGANRTVMIVESNMEMQNLLRERLKKRGYRILVLSNAGRALERLLDDPQAVDCVIFCTSELEYNALDAFRKLQEDPRTKNLPAVLLLDKVQGAMAEQVTLDDRHVAISMPFKVRELRALLLQVLRDRPPAA